MGHLTEISPWLQKKSNAWLSPEGKGEHGWEEVPYWLKGFGDLGYVLGNDRIMKEASIWIDAVLKSQREDGYFGPRANLLANNGKPDVWPNMVMLFALQSYYEHSADSRVLSFLRNYFRWELSLPDDSFLLSYWEKHRGGDNLYSVFWLYNRTGEAWLLDLARKIHRRTADWVSGVPDYHGVNFAQAFREPATYAQLSKDPEYFAATELDYQTMRRQYGEVPGGMYGADEISRKGFSDPRQCTETCAMVEMMASDEFLLAQTGDSKWADRCEDVTFNELPASMTADERALHYLTGVNMPLADARSKNPGIMNSGPMLLFDPNDHRCCQHNVAQGWPYFAEHLWMATGGNGLAATLYGPSRVTAKVANGQVVTIQEVTNYPFEEKVRFRISYDPKSIGPGGAKFPLTLRVPSWCSGPRVRINGASQKVSGTDAYVTLNRTWRAGDLLELQLPMQTRIHMWPAQQNAVSVEHGPLSYSLEIAEKYFGVGGTPQWPAFEARPVTPWNYGLVAEFSQFRFVRPKYLNPERFTPGKEFQPFGKDCPVWILAKGRRIPEWQLDKNGLVNMLQASPAYTREPLDDLILIPMGAARLRIAQFPTVSSDPSANHWVAPAKPKTPIPATSSHTWSGDTTDALSDGLWPRSSDDQAVPRFTWWDHKGGSEWVEYDFKAPRTVRSTTVYWFDDRETGGGCRIPLSWRVLAFVDGHWKELVRVARAERDVKQYVEFSQVQTSKLRLEAQLQPGFSGGILEWSPG